MERDRLAVERDVLEAKISQVWKERGQRQVNLRRC
jgi:hypothetical protein